MSWTQHSDIDLFYNRTDGLGDNILPGASGFYCFELTNSRKKDLDVTVTLSEGDIHIPLVVTLTPISSGGKKITKKAVTSTMSEGKLTVQSKIGANSSAFYQLDWNWPFEGTDAQSTAAGEKGGTYTVHVQIYAEEN
ncbi:hypothetical protein [Clostridium sp. AM58-1XD]|uniref:hypothetical protein n=1 Tax=Clostridium sp. AM58-1XD TaxID=2292307 RepID=UPI000E4AA5E2|nr:hypothetical protein [Clostridium sp. AM58-1XD]RGY96821.1 hypothetical protein DXA13_16125 [Clostridium sp. AM58-1XD]